MKWVHLNAFKPEINALYAVSDGERVGVGMWMFDCFEYIHLDDEDMFEFSPLDENSFVWWAHIIIKRFGVDPLDPVEFKMLNAEEELRNKMNIMEKFGPDILKDLNE
jgi:hypothetical protein